MDEVEEEPFLRNIEWGMMDKTKFFPFSMLSHFCSRAALYPLTLIKTRLQLQKHDQLYKGLTDAGLKIYKSEGYSGLYRGFWINSMQIFSGMFYVGTYEGVRHKAGQYGMNNQIRTFIAGSAASVVGQTIIVPFDVVVLNPLGLTIDPCRTKFQVALDISRYIYHKEGVVGFYRGYFASMCTYIPNSAIWWVTYHMYQDQLRTVLPSSTSHLFIQCFAGSLCGLSTTLITNPMDIVRARLQVQKRNSITKAFRLLWKEEGFSMFTKGLSARLVQSVLYSFFIILGYETIKRMSVKDEYKEKACSTYLLMGIPIKLPRVPSAYRSVLYFYFVSFVRPNMESLAKSEEDVSPNLKYPLQMMTANTY